MHTIAHIIFCLKYETVGCDLPALQTTGPQPPKAAVAKPAGATTAFWAPYHHERRFRRVLSIGGHGPHSGASAFHGRRRIRRQQADKQVEKPAECLQAEALQTFNRILDMAVEASEM